MTTLLSHRAGPGRCRRLDHVPRYDDDSMTQCGLPASSTSPPTPVLARWMRSWPKRLPARRVLEMSYGAAALVAPGVGLRRNSATVALTTAAHHDHFATPLTPANC